MGLRKLAEGAAPAKAGKAAKTALPSFKQYREADGKFYFKLVYPQGRQLLQIKGIDAPKDVISVYVTYTGGNAAKAKTDSLGKLISRRQKADVE